MDNIIWCLLGTVLLVSVNAGRFDQGPQTFYEPYTITPQIRESYETKDVLLYLTPNQVKALEAGGAYVRPQKDEDEPPYQTEQEQEDEQEEEEDADQSVEQEQPQIQQSVQTSEVEEIFKILNKQIEEDAKKAQNIYVPRGELQKEAETEEDEEENSETTQSEEEEDSEEKELENTRQIPARFGVLKRQRGEKYFAPSVLAKQKEQTKQANLRLQSNYRKLSRLQDASKKLEKKKENQGYLQNRQRFIPIEETPQEEVTQKSESEVAQEKLTALLTPILNNDNVVKSIAQHRGKLIQNELQLQTYLQELNDAPRHNNQKFAIELEKLRQNLAKQNALARAEALAKATPLKNREESDDAKLGIRNNQEDALGRLNNLATFKVRAQKPSPSTETVRPVPVPVIKRSRIEVKDPVPVEIEKSDPAAAPKQLYVNINEPYYVERIVPVDLSKETSVRRPGEVTFIRHVWDH